MMDKILKISVFKEMSSFLNTREAAIHLANSIRSNPSANVELDFSGIDFMSRSFADQFHKEQIRLNSDLGVSFHFINANEEIINILNTVAKTQDKKEREFKSIPVYKFSNPQLLSDYLFAI